MKRAYRFKDVEMLMACFVLIKYFNKHKAKIIALRALWADPFISEFESRVKIAMYNHLGIDPDSGQKVATQDVLSIMQEALDKLRLLKVQLEADFEDEPVELKQMLDILGFTEHYRDATTKDQEGLIELLTKYSKNMTDELIGKLISVGIDSRLVKEITQYTDVLTEANSNQEFLKSTSKDITTDGIAEFNEIYNQAIKICKISSTILSDDQNAKEEFVFTRIVKAMNLTKYEPEEVVE